MRKKKTDEHKEAEERRKAKLQAEANNQELVIKKKRREKFTAAWEPAIQIFQRSIELQSGKKQQVNLTKNLDPILAPCWVPKSPSEAPKLPILRSYGSFLKIKVKQIQCHILAV